MSELKKELASTSTETALDVASFVSSAVPWIGGPVSNVLGGISAGRKLNRIKEVLSSIATELVEFKSEASETYVASEDFEELLEYALRRVSEERSDEKRQIYALFLLDSIQSPGESYDEQIRFLRTLEELQADHLRIIKALSQLPGDVQNMMTGSPDRTLMSRLPEFGEAKITDLVQQLNAMRLTNLTTLKIMMTATGAEDLRHSVTAYGNRFLRYLID
jgi:hypothetical protein